MGKNYSIYLNDDDAALFDRLDRSASEFFAAALEPYRGAGANTYQTKVYYRRSVAQALEAAKTGVARTVASCLVLLGPVPARVLDIWADVKPCCAPQSGEKSVLARANSDDVLLGEIRHDGAEIVLRADFDKDLLGWPDVVAVLEAELRAVYKRRADDAARRDKRERENAEQAQRRAATEAAQRAQIERENAERDAQRERLAQWVRDHGSEAARGLLDGGFVWIDRAALEFCRAALERVPGCVEIDADAIKTDGITDIAAYCDDDAQLNAALAAIAGGRAALEALPGTVGGFGVSDLDVSRMRDGSLALTFNALAHGEIAGAFAVFALDNHSVQSDTDDAGECEQ